MVAEPLGIITKHRVIRRKTVKWKPKYTRPLTREEQEQIRAFETKVEDAENYISMVGRGQLTGFVWAGNHGIGKTTRAKQVLHRTSTSFVEHRGRLTAYRMYIEGWNNRDVVNIGDDCDDLFTAKPSIELVKEATDHNEPRIISWNTARSPEALIRHKTLDEDDIAILSEDNGGEIPAIVDLKRYKFRGAWIMMTNLPVIQLANVDRQSGNKKGLAGIIDRLPVVDCFLDSRQHEMLWIERCVAKDAILWQYGLSFDDEVKIIEFMRARMMMTKSPLSLRTLNLIAFAYIDSRASWQRLAEHIMRK